MLTTARPTGDARANNHELAIARALASLLEDAVSRSDLSTAAGVACQLMEQVDRLLRTSGRTEESGRRESCASGGVGTPDGNVHG
jgi:hypothetical protein